MRTSMRCLKDYLCIKYLVIMETSSSKEVRNPKYKPRKVSYLSVLTLNANGNFVIVCKWKFANKLVFLLIDRGGYRI